MSTKHLLDPQLAAIIEGMPDFVMNPETLPAVRAGMAQTTVLADATAHGVSREEIQIESVGAPDIRCLIYKPAQSQAKAPAYLHIHGGGYIIGSPEMGDASNIEICAKLGATVVSVDYRLAPEHPVPAPLDDCYAVLAWMHNNASNIGIDANRIAVGGESAGGGLAAALAIKARDAGEYAICHQHLTYPMLDDRTGTAGAPGDPLVGEFVWTRPSNGFGWDSYLGDAPRTAPQVPARAESLAGLPPTWLLTGALDLFRDENIVYAKRLMSDGVFTELAVFAGACHGFQMAAESDQSKRYRRDFLAALGRGLAVEAALS
ncbi:alpha/beta hydrolase [Pseudomonadales bacterium]|nr:alpha/beta hydrolase [Pseudomonadales bacterium]